MAGLDAVSERPLRPYPGPTTVPTGDGRAFELAATGNRVPWRKAKALRLTVGDQGVAVNDAAGRRLVGIPWSESVAILNRGLIRTLLGRDGASLTVDAAEWRDGRTAIGIIDQFAPGALVVRLRE